jgi:hypothetical protein
MPKPFSLNQKTGDDPDAILKKPGVCGIMNVTLNGRRVKPNRATFLHPLALSVVDDQPVDRLPAPGPQPLDVLLKGRYPGPLPHPKPGKSTKRLRILQMKGQLLIAQVAILLEDGTPKDLFGCHPLTTRVRTLGPNHIPIYNLIYPWVVIENPRDHLQLPGHLVSGHGVKNAQLGNLLFTHRHPHRIEICSTISRSYCEDDTPNTITIQQKDDQILN